MFILQNKKVEVIYKMEKNIFREEALKKQIFSEDIYNMSTVIQIKMNLIIYGIIIILFSIFIYLYF